MKNENYYIYMKNGKPDLVANVKYRLEIKLAQLAQKAFGAVQSERDV